MARSEAQKLTFTVPIFEPHPPQYYIRAVSDSWLQAEALYTISFHNLALPEVKLIFLTYVLLVKCTMYFFAWVRKLLSCIQTRCCISGSYLTHRTSRSETSSSDCTWKQRLRGIVFFFALQSNSNPGMF